MPAGELFSDDDLYLMERSQLTVVSTTLHLLDDKIYQGLTPHSLVRSRFVLHLQGPWVERLCVTVPLCL